MPDRGFDEIVDRRGTSSIKWDKYEGRNILPLWVADMDFMAPPAIVEALKHRIRHGIFGYTHPPDELIRAVVSMLAAEYGWQVESEAILWLPGLVTGLNLACRATCEKGENVVTAVPIYPPLPFSAGPFRAFGFESRPDSAKWALGVRLRSSGARDPPAKQAFFALQSA